MLLTQNDIEQLDRIKRLNVINSITGIKPANLIGTCDDEGNTNLAIFSSVVHLGSNPAVLGFITRPYGEVQRHTLDNIMQTEHYTINHVPISAIKQAHQTSAKYPRDISEFDQCGFEQQSIGDFPAPFVAQSMIKIGLKLVDIIPIEINKTQMVVGKIQIIDCAKSLINDEGYINLEQAQSAGLSGLNSYYQLKLIDSFPYARP